MRVAAVSDMHGNAVAFQAVIADLWRQSPDAIVCLGDVVTRGPQPKECVEMLRSLQPLVTVCGNFDRMFTRFPKPNWHPTTYKEELIQRDFAYNTALLPAADQEWLANLPLEFSTRIDGFGLELYHAGPGSLGRYTWPWAPPEELSNLRVHEATNLVLFGHMHHPFIRTVKGLTVVNTGSIGLSFDGDNRASYAIIDIEGQNVSIQLRRIAYDIELAIQVAVDSAMPDVDVFAHALRHAVYAYDAPLSGQ